MKNGFNEKISNHDYHFDREYLSSSGLKLANKDKRGFYKKYVKGEGENISSSAMDLGSYIHARILEPEVVEKEFAIFTGASRRGKVWKEFEEENEDKIIITKSQKNHTDDLIHEFERSKILIGELENEREVMVSSFFSKGRAEETLCGEIDDVKVKVRFDYRKEWDSFGSINDIKTTGAYVSTKEEAKEVCDMFDYDLSAALYVDLAEQETGKKHDFFFCFLCKKNGKTYMYKAGEAMLARGREKYKKALAYIKDARETGIYYRNVIEELG